MEWFLLSVRTLCLGVVNSVFQHACMLDYTENMHSHTES